MVAQYLFSGIYSSCGVSCMWPQLYYNYPMSILLDKAIEKARELPEADQDIAGRSFWASCRIFQLPTSVQR